MQDHICKEMSDLNLERCKHIPKNTPGADWRVLLDIVAKDPSKCVMWHDSNTHARRTHTPQCCDC